MKKNCPLSPYISVDSQCIVSVQLTILVHNRTVPVRIIVIRYKSYPQFMIRSSRFHFKYILCILMRVDINLFPFQIGVLYPVARDLHHMAEFPDTLIKF